MQVIDRATGQPIEVPDEAVQAGFQSGKFALPRGARIPVQRADGDVGTVPAEGLDSELAAGGSVLSQAEHDRIVAQSKYGGLGGMATTAGLGLVSGATAGLSDAAIAKLGGEGARKYVEQHYKANPYTKTGAQVVGALAPALVGEEAGVAGLGADAIDAARAGTELRSAIGAGELAPEAAALVRGGGSVANDVALGAQPSIAGQIARGAYNTVTAPTHLTSKVGQLAERFAGTIVGDNSPSLLARTAQSVINKGAAGMAEGALYGLGNQISEDALGNEEITAQKLLAAAGHNALFGGMLGGGLGAAGTLGSAGLSKIARSDALKSLSETQAWRALGANKPITREVDKYVEGGHQAIGRQLLADGVHELGDNIDITAQKVRTLKQGAFDEQGKILGTLDDMGARGVRFDKLTDAILHDERTVPQIVKDLGESSPVAKEVDKRFKQLAQLTNDRNEIPLKKLNEYRKMLDDEIHYEQALSYNKAESPTTAMLKGVRYHIENQFIKQADSEAARLGKSMPGEWAAEYKAAKQKTQRYMLADRAAQQALSAKYANQALSLTDKMAGFASGGSMLAGALASGGASIPAHLGHAALGLATAYASKQIRERGNATMAALLHKARDLGAIAQVTKRFDGRLTTEVTKALHGAPYRGKPVDLDDYDNVAARVRIAQSKIAHDQAVDNHLGTIGNSAPKTSVAFSGALRRATNVLAQKLPTTPYRPLAADPEPPDADKAKLLRAARIIEDPLQFMKDIRSGTATHDDVETLQKVHPDVFDQMKAEVAKQINTDKSIPYGNKLGMARLMGIDLDGTTNALFVQQMQMSWQPKPQKPSNGGSKHRKANLKSKSPQALTLTSRFPDGTTFENL